MKRCPRYVYKILNRTLFMYNVIPFYVHMYKHRPIYCICRKKKTKQIFSELLEGLFIRF